MGRPRATGDEDINLEPLLEVDDEYWSTGLTQPPEQIAGPVYMNAFIRGVHILGVLCRTIVSCSSAVEVDVWLTRSVVCLSKTEDATRDERRSLGSTRRQLH